MAKINVNKWFEYEESTKLEEQVKYYIASTVEGYLNGCYDDNYEPMSRSDWFEYVWTCIDFDKGQLINGNESSHLYFLGKDKIRKLVNTYLDNYEDMQEFIV